MIFSIPQRNSIYWCFRNLVHGLTLYLVSRNLDFSIRIHCDQFWKSNIISISHLFLQIILLLCHLSDFQHRGWWLLIIFAVILVPLAYSVGEKLRGITIFITSWDFKRDQPTSECNNFTICDQLVDGLILSKKTASLSHLIRF